MNLTVVGNSKMWKLWVCDSQSPAIEPFLTRMHCCKSKTLKALRNRVLRLTLTSQRWEPLAQDNFPTVINNASLCHTGINRPISPQKSHYRLMAAQHILAINIMAVKALLLEVNGCVRIKYDSPHTDLHTLLLSVWPLCLFELQALLWTTAV